jgi:hypothetical protein
MAKRENGRPPANPGNTGPIQAGSLLHRVLERIAREVAKSLATMPSRKREPPKKPRRFQHGPEGEQLHDPIG